MKRSHTRGNRNRRGGKNARRHSRARSASLSHIGKIVALLLLVVTVFTGGGLALNHYTGIERIGDDYCYVRADQHRVAVWLDASMTARMSDAQKRDLANGFARAFDEAPANARISLFSTAADVAGSVIEPVFEICRPAGDSAEQSVVDAPEKPAPMLAREKQDARKTYIKAVDAILDDAKDIEKRAIDSPILEQLQAVSRHRAFQGDRRTLYAITDGIQNSELGRFCSVKSNLPPFKSFAQRDDYRSVIAPKSLRSADVKLLLVEMGELPAPGMEFCTNSELRRWWLDYFTHNDAADVELTRLRFWGR